MNRDHDLFEMLPDGSPIWKELSSCIIQLSGSSGYVNRVYGERGRTGGLMNSRAASSPYLFSGLLRCGECGANYVLVSGAGKHHRSASYGCPAHADRGAVAAH